MTNVLNIQQIEDRFGIDLRSDKVPNADFAASIAGLSFFPAGSVSLLASPGGLGKSNLAIAIGLVISSGRCAGGIDAKRGPVLYLSGEENDRSILSRIQVLAGNFGFEDSDWEAARSNMYVQFVAGPLIEEDGMESRSLTYLEQLIAGVKPRLVVVDTLARYCHGDHESNPRDATKAIQVLERLTDEDRAVVALTHTTKISRKGGGVLDGNALRGSSALSDSARFVALLIPGADKSTLSLSIVKNNNGPIGDVSIVLQDGFLMGAEPFDALPGLKPGGRR